MSEPDPKDLMKQYLFEGRIMQLATVRDGQPWLCNLHMATDDTDAIYWISRPTSRHSKDIQDNPHVAMSLAVKVDKPLIGVQIEGTAAVVEDSDMIRAAMTDWSRRHGGNEGFINTIIDGTNAYKLYRLIPQHHQLFDEVNFPDSPVQEYNSGIK